MVAARQTNINKRKTGNPKAGNGRKFKAGPGGGGGGGGGGPNNKQRININMRAGFGAMFNTNQMPDNPGYMDFNEPTGRFNNNSKFFKNAPNNGKQMRPPQHHRGNMNNMQQRGGNGGGNSGNGMGGGQDGGSGNNNGINMGGRWMGPPRMGNQSISNNGNMRQGMPRGNGIVNGPFRGGPMPPRMPPMGGGPGGPPGMPPMMRPPMPPPPPMTPHMNGRFPPGGPPMMPPQMNRNIPMGGGPNGPMRRPPQFRMGGGGNVGGIAGGVNGGLMNNRNQQQRNGGSGGGVRQGKGQIKNNLPGNQAGGVHINSKGNLNKKRKGPMRTGTVTSSVKPQHQSVNKYPLDKLWVTDEIRDAYNKKVEIENQLKGIRNDELFAQYKVQLDKFVGLYEAGKQTLQNKDNDKNLIESDKSNGEQNKTTNKPNASTV